jgi:hypothetical protein
MAWEPDPNWKLHKICADGSNALNVFETDERLIFKTFNQGSKGDESITFRIKNGNLNIYVCDKSTQRRGLDRKVRTLTNNPDKVATWITNYINYCYRTWTLDKTQYNKSYVFQDRNDKGKCKGIKRRKEAMVSKIVQDWICPKLGIKPLNCNKNSLMDVLRYIIFPLFNIIEDKNCQLYFFQFMKGKHSKTIHEFVDKVLGKKRPPKVNKLLGAHLAKPNPTYTNFLGVLSAYYYNKGLMDINHIYKFLGEGNNNSLLSNRIKREDYRKFVKKVNRNVIIKYLKDFRMNYDFYLVDSISQLKLNPDIEIPRNLTNIQEVHDHISLLYRRSKTEDFDLKPSEEVLALDGVSVEDLEIVVPKTNHELLDWGSRMNNCIGSYGNQFKFGSCILFGIKKNGELTYNIEIRNKNIAQFRGKRNSEPDNEDRLKITKFLLEENIIKPIEASPDAMEDMRNWAGNLNLVEALNAELAF